MTYSLTVTMDTVWKIGSSKNHASKGMFNLAHWLRFFSDIFVNTCINLRCKKNKWHRKILKIWFVYRFVFQSGLNFDSVDPTWAIWHTCTYSHMTHSQLTYLQSHDTWSADSLYPVWQEQLYPPSLFVQFCSQSPSLTLHSFLSVIKIPLQYEHESHKVLIIQ